MPFEDEFNDVHDTIKLALDSAVKDTVATEPMICLRLDETKAAGSLRERLVGELSKSYMCVADVTGTNPNVMWEVGYAMALRKPTLLIRQVRQGLPFDVQDMEAISYRRNDLEALREDLGRALRGTLTQIEAKKTEFTIAIIGSKQADRPRVRRELESLLRPHFGQNTRWFVGSWGATDETAIELLVENKQRCIVVGHDEGDRSPMAHKLIEEHHLEFIAASGERLQRVEGGRPRDALFLARADLVCLLWTGQSNKVKNLIKWYRDRKKPHIVGFV